MKREKILSLKEVMYKGRCLDGNVIWADIDKKVYIYTKNNKEKLFSGLVYELYDDGKNLKYYQYYSRGIPKGVCVKFNNDGTVYEVKKIRRRKSFNQYTFSFVEMILDIFFDFLDLVF